MRDDIVGDGDTTWAFGMICKWQAEVSHTRFARDRDFRKLTLSESTAASTLRTTRLHGQHTQHIVLNSRQREREIVPLHPRRQIERDGKRSSGLLDVHSSRNSVSVVVSSL
jgi:hypothetical protein